MQPMHRIRHIVALVCLYCTVLTLAVPGRAQTESSKTLGWDNVIALRHGQTVIVKLFNKQKYKGKVDQVEGKSLTLTTQGAPLLLLQENIQSVDYIDRKRANILGGIVMGGGALLASTAGFIGTTQDLQQLSNGQLSSSTGKRHLGLQLAGLFIAVGGLAIFAFGGRPKTVYEAAAAPPRSPQP